MKAILFCLMLSFMGCHPGSLDECTECVPIDTSSYAELLWKHPILADTAEAGNCVPIIYGNNVGLIHMFGGPHNLLTFCNGFSGEKIWSWQDPAFFPDGQYLAYKEQHSYQEFALLPRPDKMVVVNMNTGNTVWKFETKELGDYCATVYKTVIHDHVYLSVYNCGSSEPERRMYRSPIHEKNWELIYSDKRTDGYEGDLMPPSLYVNPAGDSLLIFQDRMISLNTSPGDSRIDLMALNLRTRRIDWKIEDIDPEGNSNVRPPTIYRDKVYFMGQRTIYCVSADKGEQVWQRQYDLDQWGAYSDHFLGNMSLPVFNSMLIVHPDKKRIEALNPETGELIWMKNDPVLSNDASIAGADPYGLHRYKDYIIYSSQAQGGIFIHNLNDGKLVTRLRSPSIKESKNRDFIDAIAVDPELGHVYTSDGWFWYCYKLKL